MSSSGVNLASRPFSNQAPVLRVSVVLAFVVVVLTVANGLLLWSYFSGSGEEARTQLEEVEQSLAAIDAELARTAQELAAVDVETMEQQVDYLNLRIAERAFAWGRLFGDLGRVLPQDVRLDRLTPTVRRGDEATGGGTDVLLTIQGVARRDEALLDFVDALFASPRFEDPDPNREARRDGGLQFSLTVVYKPPRPRRARKGGA